MTDPIAQTPEDAPAGADAEPTPMDAAPTGPVEPAADPEKVDNAPSAPNTDDGPNEGGNDGNDADVPPPGDAGQGDATPTPTQAAAQPATTATAAEATVAVSDKATESATAAAPPAAAAPAKTTPSEADTAAAAAQAAKEAEDVVRAGGGPVISGRTLVFNTNMVNPFLICPLCNGYFREATTINECLHTFCKACIFKRMADESTCPVCEVDVGAGAREHLKHDRAIQGLVERMFPDIVAADKEAEAEFNRQRGLKRGATQAATGTEEPSPKRRPAVPGDWISLSMYRLENTSDLPVLKRPFLQTSDKVTIKTLKKFLLRKFADPEQCAPEDGLTPEESEARRADAAAISEDALDLLCGDELLDADDSLESIVKTKWRAEQPVHIHYRRTAV